MDIGHESLIRQWRLLREWVEEESRSALVYRRLKQTAQLWKGGDAALWRNPDLERALQWKSTQDPSLAWALRYGGPEEFELAMEFLRASEHAWSEERRLQDEREREVARQRELRRSVRRARLALVFSSLLLLLAMFATFYSFLQRQVAFRAIAQHTIDVWIARKGQKTALSSDVIMYLTVIKRKFSEANYGVNSNSGRALK